MTKNATWDEETINKLKALYRDGKYSTKQIGEILGFSKNAIVGKVHRLELNKLRVLTPQSTNQEGNLTSNKTEATNNNFVNGKDQEDYKEDLSKKKLYKLHEITLSMCVWPYGEDNITFCGSRISPGKPYCEKHFEKAYLKFNKKASTFQKI